MITIVISYSPTNVSDETNITTSYNNLSSLVLHILKCNILIISGDLNAQIGKNGSHKFCSHDSPNRNDIYETVFILKQDCSINTKFQKKGSESYGVTLTQITLCLIDAISDFVDVKAILVEEQPRYY